MYVLLQTGWECHSSIIDKERLTGSNWLSHPVKGSKTATCLDNRNRLCVEKEENCIFLIEENPQESDTQAWATYSRSWPTVPPECETVLRMSTSIYFHPSELVACPPSFFLLKVCIENITWIGDINKESNSVIYLLFSTHWNAVFCILENTVCFDFIVYRGSHKRMPCNTVIDYFCIVNIAYDTLSCRDMYWEAFVCCKRISLRYYAWNIPERKSYEKMHYSQLVVYYV